MTLKYILIISILDIYSSSCSVFIWNNKKFDLNPLEKFNDEDLINLLEKLDYPKVFAYQNPNNKVPFNFKELIGDSFSAYNNNDDLIDVNTTDLSGDINEDFKKIETDQKNNPYSLFIIISKNKRIKRDLDDVENSDIIYEKPEGAVIYIGKSKNDKYGLIYSTTSIILNINKTEKHFDEAPDDLITFDTVPRESITRLNIKFPQDGIILRFIFSWVNYYWYLTSVRVTDTTLNVVYNLTVDKEITAPIDFSYHCTGITTFSDISNDVYLYLTNIQVQIESKNNYFNDAYDCITFTTIPIWSGICISFLLIITLILSFIALGDIKTMDKFDNHKTKQLSVTINE